MKKKFGNNWQKHQNEQEEANNNIRVNLKKSQFNKSKYKKDDGEYVDYTELK